MSKSIGRNVSKNLISKYTQKRLDHAKQSGADAIARKPKKIRKTAEATGDVIGNTVSREKSENYWWS